MDLEEEYKQELKAACLTIQKHFGGTPEVTNIGIAGDRIIIKLKNGADEDFISEQIKLCNVDFEIVMVS